MDEPRTLDDYLALDYPFQALADPEGGYTIVFPDLPGCLTVADNLASVSAMALDAKHLWLETAYARGDAIPLPSRADEYSGKFNVRLPKSLHRRLVEAAERESVSLNQLVVGLLSEGLAVESERAELRALTDAQHATRAEIAQLAAEIAAMSARQPIGTR